MATDDWGGTLIADEPSKQPIKDDWGGIALDSPKTDDWGGVEIPSPKPDVSKLIADPNYDPAAHAAQNPDEYETAFQARQALQHRTFGEKAAAAGSTLLEPAIYGHAALGALKFGAGLVTAPLHGIAQVAATAGAPLARAYGAGDLANTLENEQQTQAAEATLAGQQVEQGLRKATRGVRNLAQGVGNWTGLSPEDEATERAHFADEVAAFKAQQQLAQSRPLETGAVAAAAKLATGQDKLSDVYSPEAIAEQGARPVSPLLTETMAAAGDQINLALPIAGKIPGVSTVAGGAVEGLGKALQLPSKALSYIPRLNTFAKGGLTAGAILETALNPALAAKAGAAAALRKTIGWIGEGVEAQGNALRTGIPSALDTASQAALTAGDSAIGTNAQRLIGNTAGHALSTGIGFAPVNLAMSGGDPRQFAESEVGASVMGAMMALPGETFANRPTMERIAAYRLAQDGAGQFTENAAFPAHQAQMQTFDRGSQDAINRLRSYLYRGTGTDVLVLDGKTYADTVGAIGGDTRGHFSAAPDGRTIFINSAAVASGEKPGTPAQKATKAGSTAGHEAGHAIVDFLKTAGLEGDAQGLFSAIQSGMTPEQLSALTSEYHAALSRSTPKTPGETPEQRQAIEAKIFADNPPDKILEENLSEITRKILDGQSVASLALPKPILERLTDAAAGWIERRGLAPEIDPKSTLAFKAQMVKEAARRMKTVLYETGKRASAAIDAGPTVTQEIIRAKDALSKIPEIKPDMPAARAAEISKQRTAAEKALRDLQGQVDNAPAPEATSTPQEAAEGRTRAQEGQAAAAEQLKAEGIDRAWPRIREAMARNPNLSEADEIADYVRKLAAEKNAIADAKTILTSNALKYTAAEAKQFTDAVITAHQEPVTDVQKLVKAAQRLKAGGKVEPGEFNRPDKPAPRVGATFNDAEGNTHIVTGSTDRSVRPGDFILTRDGRTQRVVGPSQDGQGVETVGTFIADESRTTPARNGIFTILETKAQPKAAPAPAPAPPESTSEPAAGSAATPIEPTPPTSTPPASETPEFRIVPLGQSGRFQIINRAGNPTSKNTFAIERDAQQSIDQQGRGRFQLPPPIMDDSGNPVHDILDAIFDQVGGIYFDKLGKEEKQQSLSPYIRGLLRSDDPKNAPDAVATVLGYDSSEAMFDDIKAAIEARRRGKKQSAQEAAKQRIAAREESQEPEPNEPPITDQPVSTSTATAVENPLETPHPTEPAPLQFDEIAQIAASAKESAIAAEKPKRDGSYTKKAQESIRKAELMSVIRAHSDRLPLNYSGIRLRTDQFGRETVTGTLDASRPFDIWLLRESGMSPKGMDHLGELQDLIGKTVQIDYRHASTGEEMTTADTRRHAQKVETAEQRASGEAAGEIQRKTVVPLEIAFNPGTESFTILGASPEKLLSNFQHLSEAMAATGENAPYPDIHDPHFVADWKGYIRNHYNNRQGDGTPMTDANGARVTPTGPPYRIPEAKFEFLNAVLGDEGAKADTAKGKEKATLAQHNARMVDNETGETNPLRDRLNKAIGPMPELDKDGKPVLNKDGTPKTKTWSKATLENPISENIRPDLVEAIHPELTREDSSIREHGYKGDIGRFFSEGIPDRPSVAAGFMPEDYAMQHRPNDEGPRAFDLLENELSPRDIYEHPEYYTGQPRTLAHRQTVEALKKIKGKPDSEVTIYRASPKDELNDGDWVSLSRVYAKQHGMADDPSEDVLVRSFKVKAKDLRWPGDELGEFGYFPSRSETKFMPEENEKAIDDLRKKHGSVKQIEIPLSLLSPILNSESGRETIDQAKREIQDGKRFPLVIDRKKNGDVDLLDGNHRAQAYKELGYRTAPAIAPSGFDLPPAATPQERARERLGIGQSIEIRDTDAEHRKEVFSHGQNIGMVMRLKNGDWKVAGTFDKFFPTAEDAANSMKPEGIGQSNLTAPVEKNVNDALLMTGGDPEKAKAFLSQYLYKAEPSVAENLRVAIAELDRRQQDSPQQRAKDRIASRSFMPEEKREPFYSQLTRTVDALPQSTMTVEQARAAITKGAKSDEVKMSGILDDPLSPLFGKQPGDKVTKADLQGYALERQAKVQDVTLSNAGDSSDIELLKRAGFTIERNPDEPDIMAFTDKETGDIVSSKDISQWVGQGNITREVADAARRVESKEQNRNDTPKFETYQLPGADEGTYREQFVTWPGNNRVGIPDGWTITEVGRESGAPRDIWSVKDENGKEWARGDTEDEAKLESIAVLKKRFPTRGDKISPLTRGGWNDGHTQYSDIANPIVRIRRNIRTDSEGRKTLFLEEIQGPSDTEQDKMPPELRKRIYEIGMKRALRDAADEGADRLGWTTGDQDADRYSLEKHLDSVDVRKLDGEKLAVYGVKDNAQVIHQNTTREGLADVIGKELAARALDDIDAGKKTQYSGLDLKVGGEGLKRLYDQTLPRIANELAKKFGVKAGTAKLDLMPKDKQEMGDYIDRKENPDFKTSIVHSIEITQVLREKAQREGFPLFMPNSPGTPSRSPAPRPALPAYRVAAMTRIKDRERQLATAQ